MEYNIRKNKMLIFNEVRVKKETTIGICYNCMRAGLPLEEVEVEAVGFFNKGEFAGEFLCCLKCFKDFEGGLSTLEA